MLLTQRAALQGRHGVVIPCPRAGRQVFRLPPFGLVCGRTETHWVFTQVLSAPEFCVWLEGRWDNQTVVKGKPRGGKGQGRKCRGPMGSLVPVHSRVPVHGLLGTKSALPELSGEGGSEASLCARLLPIALMTA